MRPAALALAALLAACGAPPAPAADAGVTGASFGATPLLTATSDSGALKLEVRSSPQPPVRGQNAFRITVTDAQGQPQTGLSLAVQPWMPQMGHGSSVTPSVTEAGEGSYDVGSVYLAMPGTWQLRVTVSGRLSDHAAPELQIP